MLHTHVYFSRMCYQIAPRVLHFSAFILGGSCSKLLLVTVKIIIIAFFYAIVSLTLVLLLIV